MTVNIVITVVIIVIIPKNDQDRFSCVFDAYLRLLEPKSWLNNIDLSCLNKETTTILIWSAFWPLGWLYEGKKCKIKNTKI